MFHNENVTSCWGLFKWRYLLVIVIFMLVYSFNPECIGWYIYSPQLHFAAEFCCLNVRVDIVKHFILSLRVL